MKCPECGKEMEAGFVQASTAGSLTDSSTMVTWYPKDQKGKLLKKKGISLRLKGDSWYCDECMKVYAAFELR